MAFARASAALKLAAAFLCYAAPSWAIEPANVLVVYNNNSPDLDGDGVKDGEQIARHYAQLHPGVRLLGVSDVPTTTEIAATTYLEKIRPQIQAALTSSTDVIVTTKYMPLRIDAGTGTGIWRRYSSLESELTRIDTVSTVAKMGNQSLLSNPAVANPYYLYDGAFSAANPATKIRLSARLDGYTVADVYASLDRAQRAVIGRPGYTFLLDDDPNAPGGGADRMAMLAAGVLPAHGQSAQYNYTDSFVTQCPGAVMGYVSHGTHGGAAADYLTNRQTGLSLTLADGAIFHSWESYNAVTFNPNESTLGQGQIGQWIAMGGTAAIGHVQEPYVGHLYVTNEDRMWDMLLSGRTFAEAAWNATGELSYVNTVIGDPLMTLRQWVAGDADLDGDVDNLDLLAVTQAMAAASGDARYSLWADMDANGMVDNADLALVRSFLLDVSNTTVPPMAMAIMIPEPAQLGLLTLCAALLRRRQRRA